MGGEWSEGRKEEQELEGVKPREAGMEGRLVLSRMASILQEEQVAAGFRRKLLVISGCRASGT